MPSLKANSEAVPGLKANSKAVPGLKANSKAVPSLKANIKAVPGIIIEKRSRARVVTAREYIVVDREEWNQIN